MATKRGDAFDESTIAFLRELSANNNRDWFNENKSRYESDVLDVALRFIEAMQEPLARIAPRFTAVPQRMGGSLMRVYRDTRFSKNKLPYKTNVGIQFRHEQAKDVHSPGYYVHIDPDEVFVGVGMWRPDTDPLRGIRERIAEKPAEWKKAIGDARFRRHFELSGDALKRPPRGFDKDHPYIDDIRRTSFIAIKDIAVADSVSPGFRRKVETAFDAGTPFMRFLCRAVGVPY